MHLKTLGSSPKMHPLRSDPDKILDLERIEPVSLAPQYLNVACSYQK